MEMRGTRKHRRISLNILFALAFGAACCAQAQTQPGAQPAQSQPSQAPPSASPTPQPPTITSLAAKTVVFITVPYKEADATEPKYVGGTGFFVGIPANLHGKDISFDYLVTNRHVAEAEGALPSSLMPDVSVTLNLLNPQNGEAAVTSTVNLTGSTHWYFPADPTVDLAVLPVGPTNALDAKVIPISLLATDELIRSRSVGLGDPVFFVGYFEQFPGIHHFDPIFRSGVLAMMPTDPIPMEDDPKDPAKKTPEHLWLADAHAFLGNSGSPLFINLGGFRNGMMLLGGPTDYLLGVVNGFIAELNGTVTGAATFEVATHQDLPNSGVLTFVPAQKLRDLLYDSELQKLRDEIIAAQGTR